MCFCLNRQDATALLGNLTYASRLSVWDVIVGLRYAQALALNLSLDGCASNPTYKKIVGWVRRATHLNMNSGDEVDARRNPT